MSDYGTTWHGRAAATFQNRLRSSEFPKRRLWLIATAVVAGLAAVRRRPWLAGAAALAGLIVSRFSKPSADHRPEAPRGRSDADPVWPLDPDVTVTSMGYPAPPTVTVGPAETSST